jgi:hypothetical protein
MQTQPRTLADALTALVGHDLSSVEFVRNYVQFHFDGGDMTAYTPPVVNFRIECLSWDQSGYRDALCREIDVKVAQVEADDKRISMVFESGMAVSISLLSSDYLGPEALQFQLEGCESIWVA